MPKKCFKGQESVADFTDVLSQVPSFPVQHTINTLLPSENEHFVNRMNNSKALNSL